MNHHLSPRSGQPPLPHNHARYDSFGKVTASSGSAANPYRYTGRDLDPETGLLYDRARYYDPTVGRFLSEDPVAFVGGNNFYDYVGNDAVDFTDPAGLFTINRNILLHLTPDPDQYCPHSAGACTIAGASLDVSCKGCSDTGWRANAVLNVDGDMFVFNGKWPYKGRNPRDTTVKDANSAIQHEYNIHINPAIGSVTPMIKKLEAKTFKSASECQKQAAKTAKKVQNGFILSLMESQREESMP